MSPAPILLRWQLPATHHDTRQHDAVLNDNAVTYLSAQSGSQFELFGSYHESQLQLMRSGEQLQIWLNGRKLAVIEQFFAQAANAEDRSAENDFLFTDSEQGKLLLSQSAAADNEGLLWPDSGEDNHDSLPVWICAAGLLGGSLALGGSSDHGVVDNTPPAAAHFALREDTGLSDRDFITQRPEIQVELASDTVSWEYSLDGGNHWHPGSGNQLLLAENSRYERGAIAIRQTDAAGNVSAIARNAATIVVDNSAPAAPTFLLAADTGSSNSDNITQDATVVVTLASDAASWQYKLKDADWSAPIATATTTFELAADTRYAAGEIQLRQTDAAGNPSAVASNSSTITVDNSAPSRAIVNTATLYSAPTDDPENAQYVTGTAALASGDRLNVTIGGQQFDNVAVTDGSWQIERSELGPLESGATLEVTATTLDLAGNQTSDESSEELQVQRSDIVIFDLTSGKSSFHGADRLFSVDETYNIFIIVDSDGVAMQSIATEQQWRGWDQLSSDDTLWLVGNDPINPLLAYGGEAVTYSKGTASALIWASQKAATTSQQAALIFPAGGLSRAVASQSAMFSLFNSADGTLQLTVAQGYLQTIHASTNTNFANIYTTQGLS